MDLLNITFTASGVTTSVLIPPLFAFVLSFFTSMGGVSGAVLILPFQVSFLQFTSPAVNSTNLLYNVVGIPGGVYRYIKEGKMVWPLTWIIIIGTIPGVFIGYYLRVKYLPEPGKFKLFIAAVLLYIGTRLLLGSLSKATGGKTAAPAANITSPVVISNASMSLSRVSYDFKGETLSFNTMSMFTLAFIVGIVGGTYGIGGGAIIAPFCVTLFNLPVYTVAGPALMGTFITSIFGVAFYALIPVNGATAPPDWPLGLLFGAGGFAGMYLGARVQKHMPEKTIKLILSVIFYIIALRYAYQYFQ
ncbi:sulfite exporter TauE/SafE family protein [Candidatus Magnetominusculus xianensis]|uniref:Probable membrane transporter protein n=1 Tax=Candidatus Magnetominusculus xianensis TaxID=1748249 RepID=A0ABR5SD90_9BACT|nr:sulfite exporter TauE/SafE family protein [Candidatus Magnetominusculus xianensis]KWT82810.1 membrane protein [Candidatus Magnetominusculus xianensis]